MKAIILAAGMGSRLQGILQGKPKPLFELDGKSLLDYSLESLALNGIEETCIAIGFEGEKIKEKFGKTFRGMRINYSNNPIYDKTGSMHSFYKALGVAQDCLVLDGDIIYDPIAINKILRNEKNDITILTNCCGSGDEVYVSLNQMEELRYLGKKLPDEKLFWEFTGISKFSKEFVSQMFKLHEENLEKGQCGEYCEDCAYRASKITPLHGFIIQGLAWSEIDKKEDIPRALSALESIKNR
jgi:choline kinase